MLPVVVALAACLGSGAVPDSGAPSTAPQPADKQMKPSVSIEDAQQQLTPRVMALPGVVGIAVGECDGQPCIKVLTADKSARLEAEIPTIYEGYRVVIDAVGEIRARDPD